jgi:hypothetical protein
MEKNRMKKIDLSFLKHKQLPFKTISQEIDGETQSFTIYPINGRGLTSIGLIPEEDIDRQSKLCLLSLMYGLGISQNEAEAFMNYDTAAADTVAAEIFKFTQEHQTTLGEAAKEIKKNSKTKTTK